MPAPHEDITGIEHIDKVIEIDQSPIGRTPRSNPATYTGLFTPVRELFASMPEAKSRGYMPGRFSFNVKGGRCEACKGEGIIQIEMNFLPDVFVPCEVCHGRRYNREALEILYKGKSIADVLEMTVSEGLEYFENIPAVANKLRTLEEVGLRVHPARTTGYTALGWRGAARETRQRIEQARDRPNALHPRRTDDRTAFRRHRSPARIAAAGGWRQHHRRDRAQSRCHQIGGLADRSRSEGGAGGGQVIAQGTPEMVADARPRSQASISSRSSNNDR
ncbi:MAG: hypothetical protein R2845_06195 [Thermomicrobiales bacterium]